MWCWLDFCVNIRCWYFELVFIILDFLRLYYIKYWYCGFFVYFPSKSNFQKVSPKKKKKKSNVQKRFLGYYYERNQILKINK